MKRRVSLALTVMVIPIAIMSGLGVWAVNSSSTKFEAAAATQLMESSEIVELRDNILLAQQRALEYTDFGDPKAKALYFDTYSAIEEGLDEMVHGDTAEERRLARKVAAAWERAAPIGAAAMEHPPGASAKGTDHLQDFYPAIDDALSSLSELNRETLTWAANTIDTIKQDRDSFLRELALILAVTLFLAGVMSRRLRNLIHGPLARLEDAARRFGDRDFDHRVDMPRNDEFGDVGRAFNAMADRVSTSQAASENLQHQLRHQALHDPLTGLANRTLLTDRVTHSLQHLSRLDGKVAVLFLDVDDFKSFNDTLGHDAGDQILMSIGERLQLCVRADDTVARFGGDEFAVLLGDMTKDEDHDVVVARIVEAMSFTFAIDDTELSVHTSIGVAITDDPQLAGEELVRRADVAMYAAKARGKNNACVFDSEMDGDVIGRVHLKTDLSRAIEHGEMKALFQPLVDLTTGLVVGAEALMRWDHPTEGRLAPGQFLPAAEEHGLMYDLDRWMLKEACSRSVEWRKDGREHFSISVNLSGMSLQRDEIINDVARTLKETGIPPEDLILEITESVFVHSDAVWRLKELKKLGVRLAIDDFGTGYSSLTYLMSFPIDILKIDKSFIDEVGRGRGSDLTRAIVGIAEALDLDTVAEGIERSEQLEPLSNYRVDIGQGYLFAKPLEEEALQAMVETKVAVHEEGRRSHPSGKALAG